MQIENIAKRTIDKIGKAEQKRATLISKRDEFQRTADTKIAEMNEDIKKVDVEIAKLREQEKTEKLAAIGSALNKKGVDINTLLAAVANNDLYTIQDILEGNATPAVEPTPAEIENSDEMNADDVTENAENGYNYDNSAENNDSYTG